MQPWGVPPFGLTTTSTYYFLCLSTAILLSIFSTVTHKKSIKLPHKTLLGIHLYFEPDFWPFNLKIAQPITRILSEHFHQIWPFYDFPFLTTSHFLSQLLFGLVTLPFQLKTAMPLTPVSGNVLTTPELSTTFCSWVQVTLHLILSLAQSCDRHI